MKKVKRNQEEPVQMSSMPQNKSVEKQLLELLGVITISFSLLIFSLSLSANYIYEGNQSLIDLTNQTGTTNLNAGDDQLSAAFNLDNSFTFYDNTYDSARMATNGCLHFGLGTGNVNYNNYCGDYTPDPLPQYTNTMFVFWTDLIRDSQSKMLAKNFNDKAVFGWYDMKEYNRNSDNSFEVILWTNNTFEYRYGSLDIIQHDVLIGEQGSTSQYYQYLFHDECRTGTTNITGTCVNTDWNGTASNTSLENGGSLYSEGYIDCSDPLNNTSCSGYAAAYLDQQCDLDQLYSESCPDYDVAYLDQQCGITQLYSESCPSYWEAYDDQQCDEDPQYAPFCAGYQQEQSIAYFVEDEFDYGYEEEEYYEEVLFEDEWYEEPVDDYIFVEPQYEEEVFVVMFDEPYEDEVYFEEIFVEESYEALPVIEEEYIVSLERIDEPVIFAHTNDLIEIFEFEIIREELENELRNDERDEEELAEALEEVEEWFEEELEEIQEADEIIEVTESREELLAEAEEVHEEESEEINEEKSSVRVSALEVVAGTLRTASNSVSNYSYRNSTSNSVSNSSYSGGGSSSSSSSTGSYGASGGTSGGGVSTSNSPSISDQITSANVQTNQVLSMSGGEAGGSTSFSITPMPTVDDSPQVMMADVQVQDMQGEIDTAISGVMTASEADQVADQIIANNIKEQQEEAEQQQEETGQYADSTTLVAYLGYVAGFDAYRNAQIPQQETWYEPRAIYTDAMIGDNTQAFYGLAGASLETLGDMIDMQPQL